MLGENMQKGPPASCKKEFEAVIWDLDGTLLDSESLSTQAMSMVLERFGKTFPQEMVERTLGLRGTEWSTLVVKELELVNKLDPEDLFRDWQVNLARMCSSVSMMPGAEEITQKLYTMGVPMAIATSSFHEGVQSKRISHEVQPMFSRMNKVICGDDPAVTAGKPAPDIYLHAASQLNVDPSACVIFEDSLAGLRSGRDAGCFTVAVPDVRSTKKAEYAKIAHLCLDNGLVNALTELESRGISFSCRKESLAL